MPSSTPRYVFLLPKVKGFVDEAGVQQSCYLKERNVCGSVYLFLLESKTAWPTSNKFCIRAFAVPRVGSWPLGYASAGRRLAIFTCTLGTVQVVSPLTPEGWILRGEHDPDPENESSHSRQREWVLAIIVRGTSSFAWTFVCILRPSFMYLAALVNNYKNYTFQGILQIWTLACSIEVETFVCFHHSVHN